MQDGVGVERLNERMTLRMGVAVGVCDDSQTQSSIFA